MDDPQLDNDGKLAGFDRPTDRQIAGAGDTMSLKHLEPEFAGEGTAEAEPSIEETYAAMAFARDRAQMRVRCIELAIAIRADKSRVVGPCDSVLGDAKKLHSFVAEDEAE